MRVPVGLLAVAGGALLCLAAAQAQAVRAEQTVEIRLTSLSTIQQAHDLAPRNALNKGDWIYFKDLLVNRVPQFGKKKNRPVAYDVGTITYTSANDRTMSCTVTFPGIGTITYGGRVVDRKDGTTVFPITGGTGGFKGATGTVVLGGGSGSTPNTIEATVPGNKLDLHGGGGVA